MRTIMLLLLFVILTWGGSAGIAYGVVELTGGGPQGEQGERGEQGEQGVRGLRGSAGSSGTDFGTNLPLQRLAQLWAVAQVGESGAHPQTEACIDYIMKGTGSFVECGFTRSE